MTSENDTKVITRFAPSPTGLLHLGNYRSALFSYLYAQKHKGNFILRIEDTDKERSKKEYEENIIESLEWMGLDYGLFFYRQSDNVGIHKEYLQKMIENGYAYISKEENVTEGGRTEVIRFKNPNKEVTFTDLIRGDITVDTTDLGDFVIAKSLEEPLFHLAVVVDDFEEGVTHIVRGEDHISNTPRQILIREAIGATQPLYAHLPLVLASDRSKLSKRKGAQPLTYYRDKGYLPSALINYMALLGWNPGTDQEIFTLEELIELFDLSKVQKSGAVFNVEKLNWVNKEHIKRLDEHAFMHEIEERLPADIKKLPRYSLDMIKKIEPIIRERIEKFEDITMMAEEGELEYYFEQPDYFAQNLLWKDDSDPRIPIDHLTKVKEIIENLPEDQFDVNNIRGSIWEYATEQGKGSVLWPLRYALSGMDRSPDPFILTAILGKEETIVRIDHALSKLEELALTVK